MVLDTLMPQAPDWRLDWDGIVRRLPWIAALHGHPQDPVHHAEGDVLTHTGMVVEALCALPAWRALPADERRITFAAALIHDVAKPETTRLEDGRIRHPGHARRGAVKGRALLWRMGMAFEEREMACAIARDHMKPYHIFDRDPVEARRVLHLAALGAPMRLMALQVEADVRGRICPDRERLLDVVGLFGELCREEGVWDGAFPYPSDHARVLYFRDHPRRLPDQPVFDDSRGLVTVMCGLPGSGKSSWIARNAGDLPVVSLDALRQELGVDPEDPQGPVAAAAREAAKVHLRVGRDFVWDATNLSRQLRDLSGRLFADYRARVRYVYVERPEPVMRAANRSRPAPVPDAAIDRMLARWEPPTLDEAHAIVPVVETPGAPLLTP